MYRKLVLYWVKGHGLAVGLVRELKQSASVHLRLVGRDPLTPLPSTPAMQCIMGFLISSSADRCNMHQ